MNRRGFLAMGAAGAVGWLGRGRAAASGALAGIRPHDVTLGADGQIHATVEFVEPRGHDSLLHLHLDSPGVEPVLAVIAGVAAPSAGALITTFFAPAAR